MSIAYYTRQPAFPQRKLMNIKDLLKPRTLIPQYPGLFKTISISTTSPQYV